ncbi:MAG TPA: S49 family peptidase [Casimicrobiaceae bacterium]|jgi:protease-4|nr:S49 family peptidase [Casimicrobiaceae bacterium]
MAEEETWERRVIERLANEGLREQQRTRRWSIFFKLLGFSFLFIALFAMIGVWSRGEATCLDKCTALVDLRGELDSEGQTNAENVISGLQAAFKNKGTQGVVLRINSPGGSPVQAGEINDEIRRLRGKYPDTPIYAVVEEVCASGAYYVAVATDKIYVDKASLIGSIGVIMDGFGFVGSLEKLGVERRALASGDNKNFLDPFLPMSQEQRDYALKLLQEIHQQFIAVVKQGRGSRLKESPELFSGLVWNGARSVDLGLADALGSVGYVAREVIKAEDVVDFTVQESLTERVARRFGTTMGRSLTGTVERALRRH